MSEETDDKKPQHIPGSELRNTRMSSVGMPAEKSENFVATSKRLGRLMAGEMVLVVCILVLAIVSVFLVVIGPKVLGHATDILFDGLLKRAMSLDGQPDDFAVLVIQAAEADQIFVNDRVEV